MAIIFENTFRVIKATDCSGIPVKVLWKTSKTFRDLIFLIKFFLQLNISMTLVKKSKFCCEPPYFV